MSHILYFNRFLSIKCFILLHIVLIASIGCNSKNQVNDLYSDIRYSIDSINAAYLEQSDYNLIDSIAVENNLSKSLEISHTKGYANASVLMLRHFYNNFTISDPSVFIAKNESKHKKLIDSGKYPNLEFELGSIAFRYGDFTKATSYLLSALTKISDQGPSILLVDIYSRLGVISGMLEDYEKSRERFDLGIAAAESINYNEGLFRDYFNRILASDGELTFVEKEELLNKSFALIGPETKNISILAPVATAVYLYKSNDDKEKLIKIIRRYKDQLDELVDKDIPIRFKIALTEIYFFVGEEEKVKDLYKKIAISDDDRILLIKQYALNKLHLKYQEEEIIDSSLKYLEQYISTTNKIYSINSKKELLDIEREYSENVEKAISRNNKLKNSLIFFVSFIFLVLFVLYLFVKLKMSNSAVKIAEHNNELLKQDIRLKDQELTTFIVNKIRFKQHASSTLESLMVFKEKLPPLHQESILNLIADLSEIKNSNIWSDFEDRFNKVNPLFFYNFGEKYPNITNNEKRLCALVFMNMTTKEISAITGQSNSAVEQARTRLRKKLNVGNRKISLSNFLSSI